MGYTNVHLKDKILEMYPDIEKFGLSASLDFDKNKNAYIVTLRKNNKELTTHFRKARC